MKTISIELHREDETRLACTREDNSQVTIQVMPSDGSGDRFAVTLADGTVERVSSRYAFRNGSGVQVWECSNGAQWAQDGKRVGDTNSIRLVHVWMQRRYEAQQAGRRLHSIFDLHRIHAHQAAQLAALETPQRNATSAFCAKYHGQRITR